MRTIERTSRFKKDFRRETRGRHGKTLRLEFVEVVTRLASDRPLETRHRDHALSGNWSDHRDCHLRPDLVLIYRLEGAGRLQLVRLGSHSELGL